MRATALVMFLAALLLGVFCADAPLAQQSPNSLVPLTAAERQWLDDNRNSIILTYDAAFPPLEYQDQSGNYAGMGADMVAKVEALLGVTFQKVPTRDWKAFLADLESGKVHLNASMVKTKERDAYAICSSPYVDLPLAIITTPKGFSGNISWSELKGRRVAVVSGYMTEGYVLEHSQGQFTVVPVNNVLEGLRGVSFGVVDAFVDNLATSSYFIERDSLTNLRVAGTLDISFPISICVSRKYPLLASAVEKALSLIPPEEIEASHKRWVPITGEGLLSQETLRMLKLGGGFAATLLICLAGVSYLLKRRLNEKVRSLRVAQQELMEQTKRLALATEATNAGIWDYYPVSGKTYFSDQWFGMLGLAPGAVPGTFAGWMSLLHPDDRARVGQALVEYSNVGGQELYEAEYRMKRGDGSWCWVLGKGRAIAWDERGKPTRIIGLNLDIQAMKTVQEELARSEALSRAAFDQTYQLCALLDTSGLVIKFNKSAAAFTGVSAQDAVGHPFWECPCWQDSKAAEVMLRQAIASVLAGGLERHEVVNLDSNGNLAIIDFSLSPLIEADGTVNFLIAEGRDITESRRFEAQLKENVETLEKLFNDSPDPVLLIHNARFIDCNKAAVSILGYDKKEELLDSHPGVLSPERQEDDELSMTKADRMMSIALEKGIHRFEWIHMRADGGLFPVEVTLSLVHIRGKQVFYTSWRDITEQRAVLKALRASEEKYRAIFSNSPVGIFRSTFEGGVQEVNSALAKMHGFSSPAEMLSRIHDLAFEAYVAPEERQEMLRALLASPKGLRMEIRLKRINGEIFPAIINASLTCDVEATPCYIDGVIEDITERKRSDEALRAKTALLEAQVNATLDGILVVDEQRRRVLMNRRVGELFNVPEEVMNSDDDSALLGYVLGLTRHPERFLSQVEHLYRNPLEIGRDEIEFKSGMQIDRYSGPVLGADGQLYGRIWTFRDITDRKSLELRLANQLAFQQALLDTIPYSVFYKGPDSRFVGFNRAYEECFGVRRETLIGKRVLDLEYLPEQDRLAYQAEDEATIANVGQVQRETSIPFADGALHQTLYSVTGFRLPDGSSGGLIGIIVDITERKLSEERLRQSEEKFSRIFEMAPESINFVRLRDLVVIDANAAFETITGHMREEAIGRTMNDLGLWGDSVMREDFLRQLGADGNVHNFEFMLRRKDGELRRVVNSAQLVSIAGEECYISVIHDITDERRMQEVLIQSEKMMSVGSLAAGIAHEINNPLGIVHQAVQNLIQRTNPDQKKNLETAASIGLEMGLLQQYLKARKLDVFLQDIQAAAMRASGIIRNMLNFSRRSESKRNTCDLHQIIEQSVFLASSDYDLKKSYDFKRVEIVLDLAENLPACNCTETEIEQVILNLLRNAAQAMATAIPPTPKPRIEIRLRTVDGNVRLEVSDNGPGMEPDTMRKVFEPFFTTKPPGVGTGLGLSVSYFIITKGHMGRMWVASSPGKGATFYIELPAELQEASNV